MTRIYFAILLLAMCALSQAADTNYMRTTIQQHFSKTRHYTAGVPYKMAAKDFIIDEFTRFGMTMVVQHYQDNNTPGKTYITNVVGIIKGRNFGTVNDKIVGVGAHYDTVANSPGVDDNGSGMAAMIEVARQMTTGGYQRKNTVIFAAFDAREEQQIGSKHFIDDWLNPWLAKNYGSSTVANLRPYGVIVLDTIMQYSTDADSQKLPITLNQLNETFPVAAQHLTARSFAGDFLSLIYRQPDDARDTFLATAFQKAWSGAKSLEFKLESFPLPAQNVPTLHSLGFGEFLQSDHTRFWTANIPGIYLTDTANYRGKMVQCYHNPCDNLSNMMTDTNMQFLSKTADAIATTVDALSVKIPGTANGSAAASPSILAAIFCCVIACLHRTA